MTTEHIDDRKWLRGVRQDVDTALTEWPIKTPADGVSKLQALTAYLDVILAELGEKSRYHACPECGVKHLAPR